VGNFLNEGNVAQRAHGPDRDSDHRLHLPLRPGRERVKVAEGFNAPSRDGEPFLENDAGRR
jgi:hypothetical protein